ncbi:hypothetical protein P4O66_004328, partial [Electrophorus voltai]
MFAPELWEVYSDRRCLRTFIGHSKAVRDICFNNAGTQFLSAGYDRYLKLWDSETVGVFKEEHSASRVSVRTGVSFTSIYSSLLSAPPLGGATRTGRTGLFLGQCISRFTNRKVLYCVKFNPDEDKQNLFVAGMSEKKIVQWDIRSGEVVQEYDRHLGAVNTITFVDENRRFVSTSDDKSLRVWE